MENQIPNIKKHELSEPGKGHRIIRFSEPEYQYEEQASLLLTSITRKEDRQLFLAVNVHDKHRVREALAMNANINVTNDEFQTPLHVVSEVGDLTLAFEILKEPDVELNKIDLYGSTPLHLATYNNHLKLVHILLLYGANPDIICRHGKTALHTAVGQENFKIAKLLLQFGAKVNYVSSFNMTPLQRAVELNNIKLIKLLFMFGATCNRNDDSYSTLSHLILAANSPRHIKVLNLLFKNGVRIDCYSRICRFTVLHLAAMRGIDELTVLLIERGARLFATDKRENNALKTAIYFQNWSTAKIIFNAMEEADPISSNLELSKYRFSVRQSFINIWT